MKDLCREHDFRQQKNSEVRSKASVINPLGSLGLDLAHTRAPGRRAVERVRAKSLHRTGGRSRHAQHGNRARKRRSARANSHRAASRVATDALPIMARILMFAFSDACPDARSGCRIRGRPPAARPARTVGLATVIASLESESFVADISDVTSPRDLQRPCLNAHDSRTSQHERCIHPVPYCDRGRTGAGFSPAVGAAVARRLPGPRKPVSPSVPSGPGVASRRARQGAARSSAVV